MVYLEQTVSMIEFEAFVVETGCADWKSATYGGRDRRFVLCRLRSDKALYTPLRLPLAMNETEKRRLRVARS